jgi:hypothetical protein
MIARSYERESQRKSFLFVVCHRSIAEAAGEEVKVKTREDQRRGRKTHLMRILLCRGKNNLSGFHFEKETSQNRL